MHPVIYACFCALQRMFLIQDKLLIIEYYYHLPQESHHPMWSQSCHLTRFTIICTKRLKQHWFIEAIMVFSSRSPFTDVPAGIWLSILLLARLFFRKSCSATASLPPWWDRPLVVSFISELSSALCGTWLPHCFLSTMSALACFWISYSFICSVPFSFH